MDFNLKRFLRRTPPDVLRQYLDGRKSSLSYQVDWHDPKQTQPDDLFVAITELAPRDRDAIVTDFENVEQLCDMVGQIALHSVAAGDARVLSLLHSADNGVAKSINLLLADDTLFEHALAAAYADRRLLGRSWSAFNIDASTTFGPLSPDVSAFEAEVAELLTRADGSMGKLKIDSFERSTASENGASIGRSVHYAIYSEGLPVNEVEFRGDELKRETRHPVHEAAILYDMDGRTLDVIAGGGKAVRNRIADCFAQNMLGVKGKISPVKLRRFALDRLKRPISFESDPADGIKAAKVTLLRLARTGSRHERLTIEVDPSDRTDICARSKLWFRDADPLDSSDWYVAQATLRIVFHPEPGRTRAKTVSIQLRAPNGSNLRDQTRQHQLIAQKYLTRWRLLEVPGA
jgi:hypothetical protein